MAVTLEVVEGWTGNLDFQLKSDGVAVDITGSTVALVLTGADGTVVVTAPTIVTATTGTVRYAPTSTGDLVAAKSPYRAHWQVTDGAGKKTYFPSAVGDTWNVYKQ